MVAKAVKIEVVGAYVDGNAPGSTIEVAEKSAKHLEKIGYAKIVGETSKDGKPEGKPKGKSEDKAKPAKSKK